MVGEHNKLRRENRKRERDPKSDMGFKAQENWL